MNQSPIFILGLHKSGTTLLRNLLDGHHNLFVIPFETHFFQLSNFWVDNEYRRSRPVITTSKVNAKSLIKYVRKVNTTSDKFGDSFVESKINEDKFQTYINNVRDNPSTKLQIETYFESIAKSIYDTSYAPSQRIVEKSVEHAEFTMELQKIFPNAKFIRILRNPYSNIVSLRNFQIHNNTYPLMHRMLSTMENSYYWLYKNKFLLNSKNYKVIKYEDLVSKPESVMQDIASFLQIPFTSEMLDPTVLNIPWKGNSTTGDKMKGISTKRLDAWKDSIHPIEIFYINKLFPFVLEDYGYKKLSMKGSFFKPAKLENPARYFVNRLYRIYLHHISYSE